MVRPSHCHRKTPVLLGLFSLVTVLALRLCPDGRIPVEVTAWYHKAEPTFSDCLTLVPRRQLWQTRYFVHSASPAEYVQLPREAFEVLLNGCISGTEKILSRSEGL